MASENEIDEFTKQHSFGNDGSSKDENNNQIIKTLSERKPTETGNKLEGLGGWLVLVGIGIVALPILSATLSLPAAFSKLFSTGLWAVLTTPGTIEYDPKYAAILLGNLGYTLAEVMGWGFITYLFFTKKRIFPVWYIGMCFFYLIYQFSDGVANHFVFPNKPLFDQFHLTELGLGLARIGIWGSYMLISKRVRNTFVRGFLKQTT